jgi:hypothetical protein
LSCSAPTCLQRGCKRQESRRRRVHLPARNTCICVSCMQDTAGGLVVVGTQRIAGGHEFRRATEQPLASCRRHVQNFIINQRAAAAAAGRCLKRTGGGEELRSIPLCCMPVVSSRGRPAGAGAMCVAAMHAHLHVGRAYGFDRVMGYGCSDRSSSVPAGRRHGSIVSPASQPASQRLARHLTAAAGHSHLPSRAAYTGPRTSSRAKLRVRT